MDDFLSNQRAPCDHNEMQLGDILCVSRAEFWRDLEVGDFHSQSRLSEFGSGFNISGEL